ncbi:MAG: hypothetical protein ACK5KR_07680 [Breznakia sp.]
MLKLENRKVKMLAVSTIVGFGLVLATASSVRAAEPTTADVPVSYDNRRTIPDANGQYGMIVPTTINFTDEKLSDKQNVEIIGINGYVAEDWTSLKIKVEVASQNGWKLKGNSIELPYTLSYNDQVLTADNKVLGGSDYVLGFAGANTASVEGTATLSEKATIKGQYTDKLTYTFTEQENNMNK